MVMRAAKQGTIVMVDRCPELSPAGWDELLAALPAAERCRVERLHRAQDRQRSATGWHLLHQLGRDRGVGVGRAANGGPQADPPADVTMSHSGSWVAVGLCETGRIGIDVETERFVAPSLVERCLSTDELSWLQMVEPGAPRRHRFFRLWTAKEAYLKAIGVGLAVDPREISIDCAGETPVLVGVAADSWQFSYGSPAAGVFVTVCTEHVR
jgi:phosphopantetheinyl transferase